MSTINAMMNDNDEDYDDNGDYDNNFLCLLQQLSAEDF
jgi:hypothetical protein